MHQPDSAADAGARKMAHPAMLPRRGSSAGGGGGSSSQEDYPPPSLGQPQPPPPPPPAAASVSSSPGPPQSLSLLSPAAPPPPPPQPLGQAGAQMKKKSGFQITSVTPAQISASLSSNNSIAEDTESYDDLDESHTEDLSSSEILDISLSRATDMGEPERSSSEETLNNFQEAESPGAVSPNQPRPPQQQQPLPSMPHPPQQQSVVINGSVHGQHYHHHHHHHHHHGHHHGAHSGVGGPAVPGGTPASPLLRKLSAAGSSDGVVTAAVPVSAASSSGAPAAGVVAHFRTAGAPGVTSASGASASTLSSIGSGSPAVASSVPSHGNKSLSNIPGTGTSSTALSGVSGNVNVAVSSGVSNGMSSSSSAVSNTGNSVAGVASLSASQLQPAASTSRFRVVKLDSSSEPFKKGRWTCTEFYDKENPVSLPEGVASSKVVDALKQSPLEVTSERESTSGSSVSSNVSTLSHYTESVGSGEMGAPTVVQQQAFQGIGAQQMDLSGTAPQAVTAPSIPHSISQSHLAQVQLHPQDANYPQQKQGVQPPMSAVPSAVNIAGSHPQSTMPTVASPQQLPYTQPTQPVQTVPVVPQQLSYGQVQAQHSTPPPQQMPMQMAPGHVQQMNQNSAAGPVPDYMQQQQQVLQTPASSVQSGPTMIGTGTPLPATQAPSMQPSLQAHLPAVSSQPVAHVQAPVLTGGANTQMMNVGQQGNVPPVVQPQQPPPAANQIAPSALVPGAGPPPPPPSQVVPPVPAGVIHPGQQGSAPGVSQPLVMAPQSALLPMQAAESLVQGMVGQQLPPVSPVPSVSAVPAPCQPAASVPLTSLSLAPSQTIAQSSGAQNGNLVQNVSQPALVSASIGLPPAQSVLQQIPLNSVQYSAQSLAQSIVAREEARRFAETTLGGLPQPSSGESGIGATSAIPDGGSSMAASLFPLKVLPLTSQLVDGEDESSSGASVVAIDNKIEQAMDLVKSHLMYAVREEVEVLKEQIKELIEKNNQLEQENNLLKTLASPEQLAQFQAQLQTSSSSSPASSQPQGTAQPPPLQPPSQPAAPGSGPSA